MLTPIHVLIGIMAGLILGFWAMAHFAVFTFNMMADSAAGKSDFAGRPFRDISKKFILAMMARSEVYVWITPGDILRSRQEHEDWLAKRVARK
jgi:hypothetical protein